MITDQSNWVKLILAISVFFMFTGSLLFYYSIKNGDYILGRWGLYCSGFGLVFLILYFVALSRTKNPGKVHFVR